MDPRQRHFYDPWVALELSHVSSHWRSIAKVTPSLWKNTNPIHTEFAWFCSALASIELEVSLILYRGERLPDHLIEPACHFIHQNAHRISKLFVLGSHPLLEIFLTTPFPELTTSIFDFNRRLVLSRPLLDSLSTIALFGGSAPKLQYVSWTCTRLPLLSNSPWNNLTRLDVDLDGYVHNDEVLSWTALMSPLSRNPNLEILVMGIPRFDMAFSTVPIPLLSLHKVKLCVENIEDLKAFLQAIFAPDILSICIAMTTRTSFSDLFSALGTQSSLLSFLDGIEGCEISPMVDVKMHGWNRDNQTTVELAFKLLDPEGNTSDLANILPAVKQLKFDWLPPQFKIPPLPDISITFHHYSLKEKRYAVGCGNPGAFGGEFTQGGDSSGVGLCSPGERKGKTPRILH
ncbi:hypothetical protein M422DRAFT_243624 [Sphaerobolus stellatus SS14]|nr:hypothetical protein M422DRAFT_243624 [Sphaerobolus stellatus SS14]